MRQDFFMIRIKLEELEDEMKVRQEEWGVAAQKMCLVIRCSAESCDYGKLYLA